MRLRLLGCFALYASVVACSRTETKQSNELSALERLQLDRACSEMAAKYADEDPELRRPYSNHYNLQRRQCLIRFSHTYLADGKYVTSVRIDNVAEHTTIAGSQKEDGKITFHGAATSDAELAVLMQQ